MVVITKIEEKLTETFRSVLFIVDERKLWAERRIFIRCGDRLRYEERVEFCFENKFDKKEAKGRKIFNLGFQYLF